MKFTSILFVSFSLFILSAYSQKEHDWENPHIIGINKELPHATFISYPDVKSAKSSETSPSVITLNGNWKFHWVAKPEERPKEFYKLEFDVSEWDEIVVPGNWKNAGIRNSHLYKY